MTVIVIRCDRCGLTGLPVPLGALPVAVRVERGHGLLRRLVVVACDERVGPQPVRLQPEVDRLPAGVGPHLAAHPLRLVAASPVELHPLIAAERPRPRRQLVDGVVVGAVVRIRIRIGPRVVVAVVVVLAGGAVLRGDNLPNRDLDKPTRAAIALMLCPSRRNPGISLCGLSMPASLPPAPTPRSKRHATGVRSMSGVASGRWQPS